MMYKILLDDDFYRNSLEVKEYLEKLIDVIKKYFDAEFVLFEPFYRSKESYHLMAKCQFVNKKILETHKLMKRDLNEVSSINDSTLYDRLPFSQSFINKINYILAENPEYKIIIPLVYNIKNRKLAIKNCGDRLFIIGNYDEEVESNISQWIIHNELIHISMPNINSKFPAKELCAGFNDWRSNILQPDYKGDKISDISEIALEVALRNNYIYDKKITSINSIRAKKDKKGNHPKRQVFKNDKQDVYLSTDFENGGFEVYDKKATHLGQYKFNGDFEKKSDKRSHPLYLK
ncbi:MAG: hypothetical protein IJC04_06800 [Oscillospiraceae bacterium]|nr:hypothetical protein [Oscillospiraceae bacterium]